MKVIVDDKIPFIKGLIERLADDVIYLSGEAISKEDVHDADILIIRTRTNCNKDLLEGSSVKLIVTATIGFDHIDTCYCHTAGIKWISCPGCNANSVCIYVHNALIVTDHLRPSMTVGVVGVGHVGSLIFKDLERSGMKVLLCDPPRHDAGDYVEGHGFCSLATIQTEADIITFHTPLTTEGKYSTYHMADMKFFKNLKKVPLIINASRGSVVDNDALLISLQKGLISDAVIDTWENEPKPNTELLRLVAIGTPHIAGYSADGKANATEMSLEAVAKYLGKNFSTDIFVPSAEKLSTKTLINDSQQLKNNPDKFEALRNNYPIRRE